MESKTKHVLSQEQLQSMTERAFGAADPIDEITELKDGYFNTAYLIRLGSGFETILKVTPKSDAVILSYENNIMQAEIEALSLIRSKTDVPVPTIHYTDLSCNLCDASYFFMKKMEGDNYNNIAKTLHEEQVRSIEREIGGYNRQINSITGKAFGYPAQPEKQSDSWEKAFYTIVTDILNDGIARDVSLPGSYDEIHLVFQEHLYACRSVTEPRLIHWDLWKGNVLVKDGNVSGIIDLERALWADPLMEYYFGDIYPNKEFCQGYGISLLDSNEAAIRRKLYNLYLYLVLKIECKYRGYENSRQDQWAGKQISAEISKLRMM